MSKKSRKTSDLFKFLAFILVAAALYKELKKPAEEREWHGRIANFIPYDFRAPTVEKLRERLWNPDDPRIFTEHVFGVGWAINFHTVFRKLRGSESKPDSEAPGD